MSVDAEAGMAAYGETVVAMGTLAYLPPLSRGWGLSDAKICVEARP
jgi:hypothetical protein